MSAAFRISWINLDFRAVRCQQQSFLARFLQQYYCHGCETAELRSDGGDDECCAKRSRKQLDPPGKQLLFQRVFMVLGHQSFSSGVRPMKIEEQTDSYRISKIKHLAHGIAEKMPQHSRRKWQQRNEHQKTKIDE